MQGRLELIDLPNGETMWAKIGERAKKKELKERCGGTSSNGEMVMAEEAQSPKH